ncbi:MAG: hypothetical protein K8U57_15865 [Planctomycetes bacterium]|nr:hypothetical protein [Planctomycetota bacterium]
MRNRAILSLLGFAVIAVAYSSWHRQPTPLTVLQKQEESDHNRLSVPETEAIWHAIATEGPTDSSPSYERPYPRILLVPKEVEAKYVEKPGATVELLLKIVEKGEPMSSIHASACIHALVWGPKFGWMATHVDSKTWDDPIAEGRETHRQQKYNACVKLVAEKKQ